jgi:hypothetical protein
MKKDGISTLLNSHCKNMASRYQAGAAESGNWAIGASAIPAVPTSAALG